MKQKEQKGGFVGILLGLLSASFLESLLPGKGVLKASEGATATSREKTTTFWRQWHGTIRQGLDFKGLVIIWIILKYKIITKMKPSLMVFIQEII